jgi:hypothetical protein
LQSVENDVHEVAGVGGGRNESWYNMEMAFVGDKEEEISTIEEGQ